MDFHALNVYNTVRLLYGQLERSTQKVPRDVRISNVAEVRRWIEQVMEYIAFANEANTFLGATIMPYYKTANEKTIQRFERHMKELNRRIGEHEPIDVRHELSRINAALGHLAHFSSAKVVREVILKSVETRKVFGFTSDNKKAIILNPNSYEVQIF